MSAEFSEEVRDAVGRTWQERHRGPYVFCVRRPHKRKPDHYTTEWLSGEVSKEDAQAEAEALLADKRDSILSVSLWSTRECQFVTTWIRQDEGQGRRKPGRSV